MLNFKHKITLLFFFGTLLALNTFAQAPESMNYQAVIRDGSGDLVASQQVGLRIKILQGSASGISVFEETFAKTTDAYGLVNLQLGTGSVQSGTFSTIDWGNGPYFVESSADVSGGTSYVTLSTTQFMSVPYALYAKNAGLDSIAIQGMIDANGGASGSGGNSMIYPDGINGTAITYDLSTGNYTVPTGKTLYILDYMAYSGSLAIDGIILYSGYHNHPNSGTSMHYEQPLIATAGDVVSGPGHINGLLVNQSVTAITHNLNTGDYTVPSGKMLYIMDYYGSTSNSAIFIEGLLVYNGYHNHTNLGNSSHLAQPVVANSGEVISGSHHFNGYLADNDFFESSSSGYSGSSGGGDLPVGMIIPFAGIQIPSGWLLCDGSSVSKSTYSNLYTALGNAWGSSSSTTFNIPDLRGRFLRGVDSGSGNDPDASSRTAINTGGNTADNVGSYQNDEFKSHDHGISTSSGSGTSGVMRGGVNNSSSSTSNRGGNETRPKNAYVNYIIKY